MTDLDLQPLEGTLSVLSINTEKQEELKRFLKARGLHYTAMRTGLTIIVFKKDWNYMKVSEGLQVYHRRTISFSLIGDKEPYTFQIA